MKERLIPAETGPKEGLLAAAQRIFAEEGYRGATVSKISKAAMANIAAVNYHFGGKEKLFIEVLRRAFAVADETYPIRGDLPAGASTERRLRAFVDAFVRRTLDQGPAGDFNRIMGKSLGEASAPWGMIIEEIERLEIGVLLDILREFFSDKISSEQLDRAIVHVMAQATILVRCPEEMKAKLFPGGETPTAVDSYIDEVTAFTMAGLKTMKRRLG